MVKLSKILCRSVLLVGILAITQGCGEANGKTTKAHNGHKNEQAQLNIHNEDLPPAISTEGDIASVAGGPIIEPPGFVGVPPVGPGLIGSPLVVGIPGPPGLDGLDGRDGVDGIDGAPCPPGCDDFTCCENDEDCLFPHDKETTLVNVGSGTTLLDAIDPAQAYGAVSWQLLNHTCVRLFIEDPENDSNELIAEASAVEPGAIDVSGTDIFIPVRDDTFFFSTGAEVTPESFITAIERVQDPDLDTGGGHYYENITNMTVEPGNVLHIELSVETPDILSILSLMFVCAVPENTPFVPGGLNPIPMAGRYFIVEAEGVPGDFSAGLEFTKVVLLRNDAAYPNGFPAASLKSNPERIEYHFLPGIDAEADNNLIYEQFEKGCIEYALNPSNDILADAQKRHPDEFFQEESPGINYLVFNYSSERSGIFADCPDIGRIVNLAVDRTELTALASLTSIVGSQIIPPGVPGSDGEPYSFSSDLLAAMALFAPLSANCKSEEISILTTTNLTSVNHQGAELLQGYLQDVGFTNVVLNEVGPNDLFSTLFDPSADWDIATVGWAIDYLDPITFLEPLFNSSQNTPNGFNLGHYSEADAALNAISAETDLAVRTAAFGDLAQVLIKGEGTFTFDGTEYGPFQAPIAVMNYTLNTFLLAKDVQCAFPDRITYIFDIGAVDQGFACMPEVEEECCVDCAGN